jgi:hypothetical protein
MAHAAVFPLLVIWLGENVNLNSLTHLIDEFHNAFFTGVIRHPVGFPLAAAFSLLVLTLRIHSFYLIHYKVAERL